ncbi:MAG: glycoside hydrolase family 78 protein [Rikenellaceae bacterium]
MKRRLFIGFVALFLGVTQLSLAQCDVASLKCEYRTNPLGINVEQPRLSWKLESKRRNTMQSAYEISVASSKRGIGSAKSEIWNSGKVVSDESIQIEYKGRPLISGERVYWSVRVWDDKGKCSGWSEAAYWEAALTQTADWDSAQWITNALDGEVTKSLPSQYYRKEFKLTKRVAKARAYVTSLGTYQLYINGDKVSDDLFAPGWTSYHKRLQYQTYDVTTMLSAENSVGAMVGDGWYRGKMAWQNDRAYYGDQLGFILKMEIEYTDGTKEVVATDSSWKYNYGAIIMSDWYDGETYDARKELIGWNSTNYDDSQWMSVETLNYPKDHLIATEVELPQAIEELKPIKMFTTPKGEMVADLGQNVVGWVRFNCQGQSGDKVTLTFAEVLDQDGNFYNENYRSAEVTDRFILKGGEKETFEPHFTFHGFRYVKFEGVDTLPNAEDVTGVVIHTPMNPTGEFSVSDPLINQLQSNILWSHRDNFLDIPTDCPQRDERLGWTGDAQVFCPTAMFNYDVANFYTKWLHDLAVDQFEDGSVPHVIPNVLTRGGGAAWADASVIIPWVMYKHYGDIRILEQQFDSMVKWIGYMESKAGESYLWKNDYHYGDWLSHATANTDKDLIANAHFFYTTTIVADIAKILGKQSEVERLNKLSENVREAFVNEYVTPNGRLMSNTQTAYLMAIAFGVLSDEQLETTKRALLQDVSRAKHLTTGFVGTPLLCNTLSEIGRDDLAFMLLMRKEYPSWLYPVTMGATTIWERWDAILPNGDFNGGSMNSFNHYSYGAIGEWMYKHIAGIKRCDESLAYKRFLLSPHVGGGLTSAQAAHESPYGRIVSDWKIEDGSFIYNIEIPANTTAQVVLPNAATTQVEIDAMVKMDQVEEDVTIDLGSGVYKITYPYMQ